MCSSKDITKKLKIQAKDSNKTTVNETENHGIVPIISKQL